MLVSRLAVVLALCGWPLCVEASSVKNHAVNENEVVAHEYESLYLVFGALIGGTAVIHVASAVPALRALPVTVVFFVLGILLALLAEGGCLGSMGVVLRSYESWAAIDPHLLLFTFLPPLLFGDAMTIDTHVARRTCLQCLILAGPGVVLGALATAGLLYYVLPYGWDFATSLMVGSILSATDPVAVVSLLKDLGASPILTMQIQGESLLNDGTAMVLFTVAYGMVEGKECGPACMGSFLLRSTLGAGVLGVGIGLFFYWWIRAANDKLNHSASIIQISLTLACAYWSFIMAEGICHISGVLSTVMASLVLATKMWPILVERQAMRAFWHVVETIGNTLVFCLAGMLTGRAIPFHVHALEDCFWAGVVYAAMVVIRLVMLLCLRPLLNCTGQTVSMKDIVIMTWGGLRGMVGLALAILVDRDRAGGALSARDGERVLFLVGGIAALTLVVNATTAPKLCEVLGVSQTPAGRTVLVTRVARSAEAHVSELLDRLVQDKTASRLCTLTSVCEAVQRLHENVHRHFPATAVCLENLDVPGSERRSPCRRTRTPRSLARAGSTDTALSTRSLYEKAMMHLQPRAELPDVGHLWQEYRERRQLVRNTTVGLLGLQYGGGLLEMKRVLQTSSLEPNQLKIVREVFLEAVRSSYWDQLHSGKFLSGSREPRLLLSSVSLAKDKCGCQLSDWDFLAREIAVPDFTDAAAVRRLHVSHSNSSVATEVRAWPSVSVSRCLERRRLRHAMRAQTKAIQVSTAFIQAHRQAQAQLASYFGGSGGGHSPEEACVVLESQIQVYKAAEMLNRIAKPVRKRMNTIWEVHRLYDEYRNFVMSAHEGGILQSKEAEALLHPVGEVLHELRRNRKRMSDELAAECADSGVEHLLRVAAALEIQREFREWRTRRKLRHLTAEADTQKRHLAMDAEAHKKSDMPRLALGGVTARSPGRKPSGAGARTPACDVDDGSPGECGDVVVDVDAGPFDGSAEEAWQSPRRSARAEAVAL